MVRRSKLRIYTYVNRRRGVMGSAAHAFRACLFIPVAGHTLPCAAFVTPYCR
jgi:hypothetical protein